MEMLADRAEKGSKKEIAFLARELVTSLENSGMSRSHIHYATIAFFFEGEGLVSGKQELKEFFREIFPHFHKFEICFKISHFAERLEEDNFSGFNMTVTEVLPEKFAAAPCARNFKRRKNHERFLIVREIQALDRYSAISKAIKKAKLLQNLFRIFHHKNEFGLRGDVIVEQCCVEGMRIATCDKSRMEFVSDDRPNKAASKLDFLLKNTQLTRGSDRAKLLSIAEFHGMSIDASSVENQILNLWISMETLAPSKTGRAKIDCVLDAFLPVTGLNYLRRIVEQSTYDFLRWDRSKASRVLRQVGGERESAPLKMFQLLSLEKYADLRSEVYSQLGYFSLLRFRLFSLQENFASPAKIALMIEAHQRRVAWQIRRIYRVRNAIVHLG